MNNFNNLMDDMKEALTLSRRYKGLFLPALIANLIMLVLGFVMIFVVIFFVMGTIMSFTASQANWTYLVSIAIITILLILIFSLVFMALDLGINSIVIGSVNGEKPSAKIFFNGIRAFFLKVLLTKIGLFFLYTIGFVLLLIPYLLYLITVGVLTGGYGILFLTCLLQAFLGSWVLLLMENEDHPMSGFSSVAMNLRFGKKYFWLMILVFFIQLQLTAYLPGLFGLLGATLATLFISYVVTTVFKIVVLLTYRRYKENLKI
ncbi:conserved membrane protein of unknown function [Petrocella atlantisensis]|uniref:DUF975 domain-containing protein n=1 Tax=Petrocella atlantisensis TaxID=2173034 RepID=A0A3P7PIS7_9FIRM|nr:hypothetical protein [Petrocella atlantisensis]VDN48838.1 conserved membrane protein of unknown function [Petrocella atlantisensis]